MPPVVPFAQAEPGARPLFSAAAGGRTIKGMMPVMICFALVCAPELFFKFQGFYSYGQLKTVVMLVMLGLAARYRFDDEQSSG